MKMVITLQSETNRKLDAIPDAQIRTEEMEEMRQQQARFDEKPPTS